MHRTGLTLACALLQAACGLAWRVSYEPAPPVRPPTGTAIQRALRYLEHAQVTDADEAGDEQDAIGDWPLYVTRTDVPFRVPVRDVTPFLATFVHHALAHVRPDTAAALGLEASDVDRAARMRRLAATHVGRFASRGPDGSPVYGFWPRRTRGRTLPEHLLGRVALATLGGPALHGTRAPWGIPAYPPELHLWPDADDTACVAVTLLDHAAIDGGAPPPRGLPALPLARWRDDGRGPRRFPPWLPPRSGAFLTWFVPDALAACVPNDVDLAVNANVLFALGRYERLDTPGATEATEGIVRAVGARRHRPVAAVSDYYPEGHLFAYVVSRAFREGPVPALAPAVEALADEAVAAARRRPDGTVWWPSRAPSLSTALAVLTLLNASRPGPLVDGGIRFLERQQDPWSGAWEPGVLCVGRSDAGARLAWTSRAFTTAVALEALCRHALGEQGTGATRRRTEPGARGSSRAARAPPP